MTHRLDHPLDNAPAPLCVGFSGGLDSTVLLHWLASSPAVRKAGLCALHVHHGLQAGADDWAAHCQHVADGLGIPLTVVHVSVKPDGRGTEAAARDARRAAFAAHLLPGHWLALSHHRDDQAETFLLRALRGSGVDGLAAMREHATLAGHSLWRPLLDVGRIELEHYAHRHGLDWIEDPSNAGDAFDRNFLRHHVLPLLEQRWPGAADRLALSAARCADDADQLQAIDQAQLTTLRAGPDALSIPGLLELTHVARARALRAWLQSAKAPPLPGHLHAVLDADVLGCPADRAAHLQWAGHWQLRRWRQTLHLLPPQMAVDPHWQANWDGRRPLPLPDGSQLILDNADSFNAPLRVALRQGGERIRLPGRSHDHALKDCLQQAGIPPWQRKQLPLLWHGDVLLAAGDAVLADGFALPPVPPGARLVHTRRRR